MNTEQGKRLSTLSEEQLDALPFGAIRITRDGVIQSYNHYEADLARLDPQHVVGKNFFREVAPCTGVKGFEGRLHTFLTTDDTTSETFAYRFPFAHGSVDVAVTFVQLAGTDSILIAVERVDQ
jgi:photoactive yellow protein